MDNHIRIPNQTLELKDCKIVHQMLYQTPLFEISIDGIDNKKLEEDIYKLKEDDKDGIKVSNWGGWHSQIECDDDINLIYKPLIDKISFILPNLPFYPAISKVNSICIWTMVNGKYSYNSSHNHPGCDISGVYYVKVPKGECGGISFIDPRQGYTYGNRFFVERYTGGESTGREPIEGNMYLFPSCLEHRVLTNQVDEDRIAISFNLTVK